MEDEPQREDFDAALAADPELGRTLFDILGELGDFIDASEHPRDAALMAVGYVQALRAGWDGRLRDVPFVHK